MFGAVKSTKNADPEKYEYGGYGIRFDARSQFSWADDSWCKNLVIFGVDNSSSVHVDNKKRISQFLIKVRHKDNSGTAEAKYPINFTRPRRRFVLRLEIKPYLLCQGNISRDFTVDNTKNRICPYFSC